MYPFLFENEINWHGKYACTLSSICVFSVFVWTGENDLKTLRVDANFLKRKRKSTRVYGALYIL